MKVLFLARRLELGGVERQVVERATNLQKQGCDVVIVTLYLGGMFAELLAARKIRARTLNKASRWDLFRFLIRLGRILRDERPDVVYSHLAVQNIAALFLRPFVPSYRLAWTISGSNFGRFHNDWLESVAFMLERSLSGLPDVVIADSHAGRRDAIQAGFPNSKTLVIPNGVDTDSFRIDRAAGRHFRLEHGVGEHDVLIGYVGRFHPDKDFETFLHMAVHLSNRQDAKFICIGAGPAGYSKKLVELANSLGLSRRLIWCANQSSMARVYNALDVLCLTSRSEGLPNVICEAAACGVPCVATDVGDVKLFMSSLGPVMPVGDSEALAGACEATLKRLQKEGDVFRQQWREHVLRFYRRDQVTRQLHTVFDNLVSERSFAQSTPR
jgi:glycosyltransferase involved in cell wall biosynthesis